MRIGFVDHHLNNFHADKFLQLFADQERYPGVSVVSAWESDPAGADWCEKTGVPRAGSPEAVAAASDAVIVLAPDNCECHLELCRRVLPAGKPVFVDKILAHDPREAEAIVALGHQHDAPLFAASSLRFAVELPEALAGAEPVSDAWALGMGYWHGYGVHTLSLVFAGMGHDVARVIDTGVGEFAAVALDYRDGRRAWMDVRKCSNQWEVLTWDFGFRRGDRYAVGHVRDFDGFYANLLDETVRFFRSGRSPVSEGEMLATVDILAAAESSRGRGAEWVGLPIRD